jgi:hypothetical protein
MVRFSAGARDFCRLHRVQAGTGTHPGSYPMGAGGSFPGDKADHSVACIAEVKNSGAIPPLPTRLHSVVLI